MEIFVLIVLFSVLINAFFAMSEIGVVSAHKGRLQKLASEGHRRAGKALELINAPSRFLSTIQIGITFAGILGAIYGGAPLAAELDKAIAPFCDEFAGEWFRGHALTLCEGFVSLVIGTISIIFGELIPKRLALVFPNQVAVGVAGFMLRLSKIATLPILFMSGIADGFLRIFGIKKTNTPEISEDEVRILIDQGMMTGVFHAGERDMVEGILSLDNLRTGSLMTPRNSIVWINLAEGNDAVFHKIAAAGHTHYPVYDGNADKVLGMLSVKALWANLSLTGVVEIRNLLTEPLIVPVDITATKLLEIFKKGRRHVALVSDEFGLIVGMVSLNDVMEAIVGDIAGELPQHDSVPCAKKNDDGSWELQGLMEIGDVREALLPAEFPEDNAKRYHTLAGYLLNRLGKIPAVGDVLEDAGFRFEILAMDKHRIERVRVDLPPPAEDGED